MCSVDILGDAWMPTFMDGMKSRDGGRAVSASASSSEGEASKASFRALQDFENGEMRRESSEAARDMAAFASVRISSRKAVCIGSVG